jgi:hypothetical protein
VKNHDFAIVVVVAVLAVNMVLLASSASSNMQLENLGFGRWIQWCAVAGVYNVIIFDPRAEETANR